VEGIAEYYPERRARRKFGWGLALGNNPQGVPPESINEAADVIRSRTFDAFTPLIIISVLYCAVSWLLLLALEYLERRTDPAQRLAAMRSYWGDWQGPRANHTAQPNFE
jgi:hypothetical protein